MTTTAEERSLPMPPEQDHRPQGHHLAALEAQAAADFAARWRDGQIRAAARIIERHGARTTGKLPDAEQRKVADYLARADVNAERAERYAELRDHHLRVAVKSEPRVYGPGSQESYLLDFARVSHPGAPGREEAQRRLDRHATEVAFEARAGSAEGQRALRSASTRARDRGELFVRDEQRAMSSLGSSGGAFVTPQHLEAEYGIYRSYPPAFYGQTNKLVDSGVGVTMYIPAFDSGATVADQGGENTDIANSSPTAGYLSAQLVTYAGEIDVSQQLFDRGGPLNFDQIAYAALRDSLMAQVSAAVISTALTTAGTVAGATAFTVAKFYGDVAKAKSQLASTAGTKLPATHVFLQPSFGEWVQAQADPNGRPILLPTPAGAALPITTGQFGAVGYTGNRLLGTCVFEDGGIPSTDSGTETQIIVANMSEVFTLMSEPAMRAIPETLAEELTVVLQLYALLGVIVRHHPAIQVVSGAAYPAVPTFA